MSNEKIVVVEERDTYAIIRMNRHAKRNAMNEEARKAMLNAFEQIKNRFSVVILTGTETSFCSGIDLKEINKLREEGLDPDPKYAWEEVNIAIREHPAVFIAAVNGISLGGGTTLINMCDLAVAAEDAQMGMPEMGFGIYPGLAGPSTQYCLPRKRVAWMILSAKRIDGITAERWGLVNQVVARSELMDAAELMAREISQFDPVALSESKKALDDIPNEIDWRSAFKYGVDKIGYIRQCSDTEKQGLDKFSRGERNVGQGV